MSRLSDAIDAEPNFARRGPKCGIARILDHFEPVDQAAFEAILDEVREGARTGASVSRILARLDIRTSSNQINRHVRGDCSCQAKS